MDAKNPPAFPTLVAQPYKKGTWEHELAGMTLRDYFAAKAPMPNACESADLLEWECMENTKRPLASDTAEMSNWQKLPRFDELWKNITNQRRAQVCATFQFMYADAMLAARGE